MSHLYNESATPAGRYRGTCSCGWKADNTHPVRMWAQLDWDQHYETIAKTGQFKPHHHLFVPYNWNERLKILLFLALILIIPFLIGLLAYALLN